MGCEQRFVSRNFVAEIKRGRSGNIRSLSHSPGRPARIARLDRALAGHPLREVPRGAFPYEQQPAPRTRVQTH